MGERVLHDPLCNDELLDFRAGNLDMIAFT